MKKGISGQFKSHNSYNLAYWQVFLFFFNHNLGFVSALEIKLMPRFIAMKIKAGLCHVLGFFLSIKHAAPDLFKGRTGSLQGRRYSHWEERVLIFVYRPTFLMCLYALTCIRWKENKIFPLYLNLWLFLGCFQVANGSGLSWLLLPCHLNSFLSHYNITLSSPKTKPANFLVLKPIFTARRSCSPS